MSGRQTERPYKALDVQCCARGRRTAPLLDDPLIRCQAGEQLVLAYVSRTALMDYFHLPGDMRVTLQQWNLVVDRNLEAFQPITFLFQHGLTASQSTPQCTRSYGADAFHLSGLNIARISIR